MSVRERKSMKRHVFTLALLLVLVLAFAAACGSSMPKGAVVKVGNGKVTKAQYDKIVDEAKAQSKAYKVAFPSENSAQFKSFKAQAVRWLVQVELIRQQADKMGVKVTKAQLDARINTLVKSYGGITKVNALLAKQGMTMADLRSQV